MRKSTLKKWKRDVLEVEWDYKPETHPHAKEAVGQARLAERYDMTYFQRGKITGMKFTEAHFWLFVALSFLLGVLAVIGNDFGERSKISKRIERIEKIEQ